MADRSEYGKKLGPGLKKTRQRLAILEYLEGNTKHPSAEEIFRGAAKKNPSLSFATVYNTLNTLARAGTLRELTLDSGRRRFDPDTSSHHHFICVKCRKITDVTDEIIVDVPKRSEGDFTILGSHIEFFGYCSTCGKNKKADKPKKAVRDTETTDKYGRKSKT